MDKLEFTNKVLDNLNDSISEDGKVGLAKFIELTNDLYEAINYTRCCKELEGKKDMSFEEWLRVEDIKMHQDGTFYISSERRYVELTFLIDRYNSLKL